MTVWLKLIGAACIIAGGAALGRLLAGRLSTRASSLRSLRLFFQQMRAQIEYVAEPVDEIVASAARRSTAEWLSVCAAHMRAGLPFPEALTATLADCGRRMGLTAEDIAVVGRAASRIGSTDIDGQMSWLSLVLTEIDGLLAAASADEQKRGRLFRSLGLLGGAAMVILLL